MVLQTLTASANPTGGHLVSGAATITNPAPGTLFINQSSNSAIINWQDFSIASGELTRFQVPTSLSATLNRVTGGNVSMIYGTLQSNGRLYLVNPNGIVVGASGEIDTAGFVASTLNFSDSQFNQQGDLNFSGSSNASINNQGTIHASTGDVYLIATQVNNGGTITAPQGNVGLAAGSQVLLQKAGDQHLFVQVDNTAKPQATGVTNTGAIRSAAAELRAAGGNAYALAINNSGNIAATGITKINGQVYLTSDGGDINNSGNISAKNANGNGGTIVVDGSGTSSTNTVRNSGTLDASATVAGGNGGSVTLKNMGGTTIHSGKILAMGGQGGTGGNAEISGAKVGFTGTVDLTAPGGKTGNLLLDPTTLNVITSGTGTIFSGSGENDPTSTTIDPTTVEAALDTANLTLNADTNVTVTNAITWTAATTLTLSVNTAGGTININAPISGYSLQVYSSNITINGATVTTTAPSMVSFGFFGPYISQYGMTLFNDFVGTSGQINITNSTITGSSMLIGYDNEPGLGFYSPSQLSINNSAVHLVQGANPSSSNLYLGITGAAATPGSAGVSITNGSSITAVGGASGNDQVNIQGTGLVAVGSDAIGVLIDHSTLTNGASTSSPGDVDFQIQGYSDSGSIAAAPATFGAASAYGTEITDGSTLTNYSANTFGIHGRAYADDDNQAIGTLMNGGSTMQVFNSHVKIDGSVQAETLAGGTKIGAAYMVEGVGLNGATLTSSGIDAGKGTAIQISGGVVADQVTATDNGNSSIAPSDYGVNIVGTQILASGDTAALSFPILITGEAGSSVSTSSQVATSVGVSVSGGSTITNSGEGVTVLGGLGDIESGGSVTGQNVVADGVEIAGTAGTPEAITATGGGSIVIGGLGGSVGSGSGGSATGIDLQYANVTTSSGIIALFAIAGSQAEGSTANLTGLNLSSATVATGTTGGTQIHGGGLVPPLILIYATDSSFVDSGSKKNLTFQLGSPTGYAIQEDANSSLVTRNLVMGNYYDLFKAYVSASVLAKSPTFAAFNNFITGGASSTISAQGITFNPAGIIDLTSHLNQITNLDSALDGSGGFDLYDKVSLTVDPIGGSNNQNFGQIDEAGLGPVTITVAQNQNLTLTDVSPITGVADSAPVIGSVIATSGTGDTITLVTSGTGELINQGGASSLSTANGAAYVVYANDPSQVNLDGLIPAQPLFNTPPGSVTNPSANTIAFATANVSGYNPNPNPISGPGPILVVKQITDTLFNNNVTTPPPIEQPLYVTIVPGAGGVAGGGVSGWNVNGDSYLKKRLAQKFGLVLGPQMFAIMQQDLKDGSPLNTDTLMEKWVANTGFSKLVQVNGNAELFNGLAQPMPNASLFFEQSQTRGRLEILDELSLAAFGHGQPH